MQKIYIVEDDKNIAEIEEFALKNSGFEVYTFSNAKNFDKKMENKYPDLIITGISTFPFYNLKCNQHF